MLDAMLDVETHLRQTPRDATFRARSGARYVSLLRYLCHVARPDDPQPWGYDAIIIVAHSQGSVITADLLRFLHCQPDPLLKKLSARPGTRQPRSHHAHPIPLFLFTMGCPLRQLYSLRFPNLYGWARHADRDLWTMTYNPPAPAQFSPSHIPSNQKPNPGELAGVCVWANAFRSGDYVGRYLWRSELCDYAWHLSPDENATEGDAPRLISTDEDNVRREFCIGPGAHTHYWDSTAPAIADYLDELVHEAASTGCPPPATKNKTP